MRANSGFFSEKTNVAVSLDVKPCCARERDSRSRKSRTARHGSAWMSVPVATAAPSSWSSSRPCCASSDSLIRWSAPVPCFFSSESHSFCRTSGCDVRVSTTSAGAFGMRVAF